MARGEALVILAALVAALVTAGCSGGQQVGGCFGSAVIVRLMPSAAVGTDGGMDADGGSPGDGGSDARPSCTGTCDEYIETLRLAIEASTAAACERQPLTETLICVPSGMSAGGCQADIDTTRALAPQIRDYLAVSWPEIDGGAVSVDDCLCNVN